MYLLEPPWLQVIHGHLDPIYILFEIWGKKTREKLRIVCSVQWSKHWLCKTAGQMFEEKILWKKMSKWIENYLEEWKASTMLAIPYRFCGWKQQKPPNQTQAEQNKTKQKTTQCFVATNQFFCNCGKGLAKHFLTLLLGVFPWDCFWEENILLTILSTLFRKQSVCACVYIFTHI